VEESRRKDKRYDRALIEKHKLGFPLLHDPGNKVASEFGMVWTLPDYTTRPEPAETVAALKRLA